ncbi:type IIL restriction-modification enzyme MmeI, partial [Micrococcus sp. HSID17245]|uniref:type IIL restriction-modification enzyme MmeI n=1 Tax=Micrococcus sp. HSID17245 TaxID=2419508 RepID=UPI00352CE96F
DDLLGGVTLPAVRHDLTSLPARDRGQQDDSHNDWTYETGSAQAHATHFHFGVLQSRTHNAWMRIVTGRLKSDYQYSVNVVYNNFIWPEARTEQRAEIERLGRAVLDARAQHPEATIAQMYEAKNDFLYPDLMAAHQALDDAVERAYGLEPGLDEADLVAHLFELYGKAVGAAS